MQKGRRNSVRSAKPTGLAGPVKFNSFADIADRYKRAVVMIEVLQERKQYRPMFVPFDLEARREVTNVGSGFVCDNRGYVVTNHHVIQGADQVRLRFFGKKDPVPAQVVKTDDDLDLALLKTRLPKQIPVLRLGHSDHVRVGEWVMAIGNPLALEQTVTVGVVSAVNRPLWIGGRHYKHLLQTDAAINRGNSGGPLFNASGKVIGVNTAVSQSSQGIGFSIRIDVVRDMLKKWIPPDEE